MIRRHHDQWPVPAGEPRSARTRCATAAATRGNRCNCTSPSATANSEKGPLTDETDTVHRIEHEASTTLKRQGLYPCESEIARRLSQSEKQWRRIAPQLERQGLPKIDPLMRGRFWP